MDPLSVLGTAFSVAQVAGAVLNKVIPFVNAVPQTEATVRRLVWNLRHMKAVMLSVGKVYEAQQERHTFQRRDWTTICDLLKTCDETMQHLNAALSDLPTGELSTRQQTWTQLKLTLNSKVLLELQAHMSSSVQLINVQLHTISL